MWTLIVSVVVKWALDFVGSEFRKRLSLGLANERPSVLDAPLIIKWCPKCQKAEVFADDITLSSYCECSED